MYDDLKGKIAVVTGSARGIGKAGAKLIAEHGATVIIADILLEAAEATAKEFEAEGLKAAAKKLDVSKEAEITAFFADVVKEFGRVDILVNNAGIFSPATFDTITMEEWDRTQAINLKSVFLCSRTALGYMKDYGYGKIVNTASMSGEVGAKLAGPDYSASKAGVINITKVIARYAAPYKVTVNSLCPGLIATDMADGTNPDVSSIPLGYLGTAEDVAGTIYFLASGLSDYITGANISVNGGIHMLG